MVTGADLVGQYQIVVINRGQRDGIGPGNVLAVDQAGEMVPDLYRGGRSIVEGGIDRSFARKCSCRTSAAGTLLVFKSFDRVSYGLIVGAADAIHVGDFVRNP